MRQLSAETADAIRKVQELAAYREEYIRKKGMTLSFKHACRDTQLGGLWIGKA